MKKIRLSLFAILILLCGCATQKTQPAGNAPFVWEGANMYFLLTDRFNNGDTNNDINFNRTKKTGKLRGFEGGDIKGITQKIEEGYFDALGINAIWFTPVVEQIHDATDEGTGNTYGFHGYWAKDWTALDPNFGTEEDLATLVNTAHAHNIRIVLDGVINHTGPVTATDKVWPEGWVRTQPQCRYDNYENTTACTLVKNLPDIKTESDEEVALPETLAAKWKQEGRYEKEVEELDMFFERTGYTRTPKYYIIKWLTDYITDYGVDGYRADTVKHLGEDVWKEFSEQCDYAFNQWKQNNPEKVLDKTPFFTLGEVYNYGISAGQYFDFGDKKVNYYAHGFDALINFEMKYDAGKPKEEVFSKYSRLLEKELIGNTVVNYVSSHDDSAPFDKQREKTYDSAVMLMLTPGISQVYYGDETGRPLDIEGTVGDATLRSFMNWDAITNNTETRALLGHWQKLGQFRKNHPAVGAGRHIMISESPYIFERIFVKGSYKDAVLIGLDLPEGIKEISVGGTYPENTKIRDAYSGETARVVFGKLRFNTPYTILLLEKI